MAAWMLAVLTMIMEDSGMNASTRIAAPVHIRWMIRRDMPEVLTIEGKERGFPQWWEGMQVLVWDG